MYLQLIKTITGTTMQGSTAHGNFMRFKTASIYMFGQCVGKKTAMEMMKNAKINHDWENLTPYPCLFFPCPL